MQKLIEITRRPDIAFHRNGIIRINARAARLLNLYPGDSINIAMYNGEFLLFATPHKVGRHEAQCHPSKKGSKNFCANSVRLVSSLFQALGISPEKASFMVGEPFEKFETIYLPIITHCPLCLKI